MNRFLKLTAVLSAVSVLALAGSASAVIQSAIEEGNIYRVKNVTKNTDFTDPVSADACDVLQYWVRVHNVGPTEAVANVKLKATFPSSATTSNVSTMTVTGDNIHPTSVTDTATVNLSSSQSLIYQGGSTQLFDANGVFMKNLPDGITQGGVNIGTVGVSVNQKRFVQFKVKINCPQPPAPKVKFACTALDVTKVDRTRFDFTARASVENATVQSYVFTTKNSAGSTVDTTTVTTNALSAVYHFNQSTAVTYTINAIVNTDKGNTGVTKVCTKQVTVEAPPVVQGGVTPPPAQQPLPKTGAAGVAGLFAGASALGTAGHYLFRRYRG